MPGSTGPFWGDTDVSVDRFVGTLDVEVGDANIAIPMSSYIDLGDPSSIAVEGNASDTFIVIEGVGESRYVARLQIHGDRVIGRRIFNVDFPDQSGESSRYLEVSN